MKNYARCNNCGYDLYGPEYISNVVDSSLFENTNVYYPPNALLNLSAIPDNNLTCPNCNITGNWSKF